MKQALSKLMPLLFIAFTSCAAVLPLPDAAREYPRFRRIDDIKLWIYANTDYLDDADLSDGCPFCEEETR